MGRAVNLGRDPAPLGALHQRAFPGVAGSALRRRRRDCRPARGTPGLHRHLDAHALRQRPGDPVVRAAGLPGVLPAGDSAHAHFQPADHHSAAAVLDLAPGPDHELDRGAGPKWGADRDPGLDRPGRRPGTAAVDLQHDRHHRGHDPHPAAVHDPADLQRDAGNLADLHARGALAGGDPGAGLLQGLHAADGPGHGRGRHPSVHSGHGATTSRRPWSAARKAP